MDIIINSTKTIDDTRIMVFFTLTDDDSVEYRSHAAIPSDTANIQALLDDNIETYYLHILLKQYPGSDYKRMSGNTDLLKMQNWISAGHKRIIGTNEEGTTLYEVITQVPFEPTHAGHASAPEYIDRGKISDATRDELANATTIAALRTVLQKILLGS